MNKSAATGGSESANEGAIHMQSEFIEPWVDVTKRCTRVTLDWSAEAIRFASHRLERNRETLEHLPKCGNWEEVVKLQMNWTKDLMQDWLDESRQFMEIAQKASERAADSAMARRTHAPERGGR